MNPQNRLIKHIARCYLRLSENKKAKIALTERPPMIVTKDLDSTHLDEGTKNIIVDLRDMLCSKKTLTDSSNAYVPNSN